MEVRDASAECGLYKESMLSILRYVGLEGYGTGTASMPRRTASEEAIVGSHRAEVEAAAEAHERRNADRVFKNRRRVAAPLGSVFPHLRSDPSATIFLSPEETVEWRAYMAGLPQGQRHAAAVKRRLSLTLWRAHMKGHCLYCWLPAANCLCDELEAHRQRMPREAIGASAPVTMLLHAEELMRSTNSGHIAAYLLDAPLRIWGVPTDDAYLSALTASQPCRSASVDAAAQETLHVSLYPEKNAPTIEEFIKAELVSAGDVDRGEMGKPSLSKRVHLILSDSTWGQALSLNRHIPRSVPRVALDIPDNYDALFAALRKRTRESGVSTLEATSMAVEQCLRALGKTGEAATCAAELTVVMKRFVDVKCLLKFTEAQFSSDAESTTVVREKRDAARRELAVLRMERLQTAVRENDDARVLLLPPVLNYCYCCERAIGWHRMPEHVLGKTHRAALLTNATCQPSAASAQCVVPDFSRPWCRPRGATETAHDAQGSGRDEE